ncbi:hypothetical protein [Rhizobium sp. G21]|uniref:hypothetical protein n=1 Tax=Rhizobium sp. G21 TaxID=2758439 RepID=UPI001600CB07|nr:hypothetical protein [Rhizobium sp. G21]MBB1248988.1 hypothetical protein [Rhizobium sp. G21]
MLTPFSSGVTPTASLKTNNSDQRMSPAFSGAQPLAEGPTPIQIAQPIIGLEPEALLANVKTETATALNQTVLQTLAAAVAARMGVERLPDELLEAFFVRLAAAIERKPSAEQGKIETRAGLKPLQIPLSDLAPALRDPSGPVAARLTAKAEAPMAAPQKTAAAGITDSYLQTGSTPARSAETVAMSERNRLSTDTGNLLFQNAAPKTGDGEADNASQTQFRTLFAPDAAGFERDAPRTAPAHDVARPNTVARRGAGPAASGPEGPSVAGPEIPLPDASEEKVTVTGAPARSNKTEAAPQSTPIALPATPEAESKTAPVETRQSPVDKERPTLQAKPSSISPELQQASPARADIAEAQAKTGSVTPMKDAPRAGERLALPDIPPLDPQTEFGEKVEDNDLQRRLFRMLTSAPAALEDRSPALPDLPNVLRGRSQAELRETTAMTESGEALEPAAERSARSRDVISSTLLPTSTTTSQPEATQRAAAASQFGVPFGYVTTPPGKDAFEARKAEDGEGRHREDESSDEDADQNPETPDERRERLAREGVDRLLQPEAEPSQELTVNRDSTEADRAFAYYQRLAGF